MQNCGACIAVGISIESVLPVLEKMIRGVDSGLGVLGVLVCLIVQPLEFLEMEFRCPETCAQKTSS